MNIECRSNNGDRCRNESHKFRIGIDTSNATEFRSGESEFSDRLTNAVLDHVTAGRPGNPAAGLFLQVWTDAEWRNVQNRTTGGVMAITHEIAGQPSTAATLFLWACDSVQIARDLGVIASGLAREATE